MPAGLHSVWVYPDPTIGAWTHLASNWDFGDDAQGWVAGPFQDALVWSWPGQLFSKGGSVNRDEAYPIPKVAIQTTYRVRVRFQTRVPALVAIGMSLGVTARDAQVGEFWEPGGALDRTVLRQVGPGTHIVEATFNAPVPNRYQFVAPFVRGGYFRGEPSGLIAEYLSLEYQGGDGIDVSCLVDQVTINHGRDDATGQPEASSATVEITTDAESLLPTEVEVGAVLMVTTATDTSVSQRFVGRISDVTLGWTDAQEDTPDMGVAQVVAAGILADLGRRIVGDVPWPQELDGSRVNRVMTAAGITLDPLTSDPGTVELMGRDVDSQPALDLAQEAASNASGLVWQTRGGEVRYADAEHRRGVPVSLRLDACNILVTPTWRRTVEGLVNQVSIGYGPTPEEGEQPRYLDSNTSSINRWGLYAYTQSTDLARLEDAAKLGRMLLARNADPVWIMAALPVDVQDLDDEQYDALLALDMHDLVNLTGLPAIGSAPTSANLWLEGFRETLTWGGHEIDLVVSGFCRTSPAPRWDDVSLEWTWDTMPADITWDGAACLGPPDNLGRWNDQPATLRWGAVDYALTWDTFR